MPGGFAIVLALTALMAFFGYYNLRMASDKAQKADNANLLVKELLEARLDEKNFGLTRDHDVFVQEKKKIERIVQNARLMKDSLGDSRDRDRMDKVVAQAGEYLKVLESYVRLSEQELELQKRMDKQADLVMRLSRDISLDQNRQFLDIREKMDALVKEKLDISADCNHMINYVLEARAWRVSWILEDNKLAKTKWESLGGQIMELLENLKTRFRNKDNLTVADFAISSYANYGEKLKEYLNNRSKGLERAMLRAENSALKSIEEIKSDQEKQLLKAQADKKETVDDKLSKAADAGRISGVFLQTRLLEKNFISSGGDPEWKQRVVDHVTELLDLTLSLKKRFTTDENIKQIDEVIAQIQGYRAAFDESAEINMRQQEAEASMLARAQEVQRVCEEARTIQLAELNSQMSTAQTTMASAALLGVLFGTIMAWLITKSITKPLARAVKLANAIGLGDLSRRLKLRRRDEIGQLGEAFDLMSDSLEAKVNLAQDIAAGDLTVTAHLASENDSLGIAHTTMIESLNEVLGQVKEAAVQAASGASQISDSSQALSQGASEQAASLEEITSSMTEIGSQTKLNAENAAMANQLADASREAMQNGGEQMKAMASAMEEINKASEEIADIIKTIDEISFQTNLLALNAAVEAARAGRHGKGFAVVAQEVGNLAARSASAAQNIAQLIDESVKKIQVGSEKMNITSESLTRMIEANKKVRDIIEQIAIDSRDQAQGIAQINLGLGQIEQVTQQNTASAEETASAAEQLSGQSAYLQQLLTRFKLKTGSSNDFDSPSSGDTSDRPDLNGHAAGPDHYLSLDENDFGDN